MHTRPEAYIAAYGTAYPPLVPVDELTQQIQEEYRSAGTPEKTVAKFGAICKATKIQTRPMVLGKYHAGRESSETLFLGKPAGMPWPAEEDALSEGRDLKPEEVAALWLDIAPKLSLQAARSALERWSGNVSDITHVITTNTSGWHEPGLACHLIHELGLSLNTQKAELNYNGCFCGMTCLRLARDIVLAGDDERPRAVLVVGTELPSLHFSRLGVDADALVSYSLFSDGSAAFIVANSGAWRFKDSGMSLVPDSTHLLGMGPYAPLGQPQTNGSNRMTLSPDVPAAIASYFSKGLGNELLASILARNSPGALPDLAVHPGGPKILDALTDTFSESFGFDSGALGHSFGTLIKYGNLGCTAMLFVLAEVLAKSSREHVVSMAFGPGVTVEWGAFERVC